MMDKNIIKKSFSEAARSYDSNSELQSLVAEGLMNFLRGADCFEKKPAYSCSVTEIPQAITDYTPHILDIGCGTGSLTAGIKGLFPEARVHASDIALPMLAMARQNLRDDNIGLVQADFEALPFNDSTFDAVASSLAYQWAQDVLSAFREAWRVLKKDGLLVFSTLGPDTLRELRECYASAKSTHTHFMPFMGPDALAIELKEAGLEVEAMERHNALMTYEHLRGLVRALRDTGASPPPVDRAEPGLFPGLALKRA